MTMVDSVAAFMQSALSVLLLLVLLFYFWRQYRVDALREKLFRIRGELFDYAATGAVSFDDPAYARLRVLMNSMIRFAHKLTPSRVMLMVLFVKPLTEYAPESPLVKWEEAVSDLSPDKQVKLHEFHDRMMNVVVLHLTKSSVFLSLAFALFAILSSIASGKRKPIEEVSKDLPGRRVVEVQAINAEQVEEEREPVPA